ncbi:MAG: T9SS type A sorting domain-containing protein [Candidatus Delongbacteria bacterium]|nr:T9SS type A sorting domain-containing protein [Candidatus Delongbacteria bacterium]
MMLKCLVLFVGVILSFPVFSQNDCTSPDMIGSLPYSANGLTTTGTLDDYGPSDACGSNAMENEDYVFSFTPASDMNINISLSNTEIISDAPMSMGATIGLFVVDGVPTDPATNCVASSDAETADPYLDMVALTAGTTYYIIVSSEDEDMIVQTYPTNVNFDISVTQIATNDAGVVSVDAINSDCGLTSASVSCTIKNFGTDSISGFDVAFTVDGGAENVEIFSDTLAYNETADFAFSTPADMSGTGEHVIQVYTLLSGDGNTSNDTAETVVVNLPVISTFPYTQGFEDVNHYWSGTGSWARGMPLDTNTISEAYEGDYIAGTNPEGNAQASESSTFTSPCFDFSGTDGVSLSFAIWHEPGMLGADMSVETSIDGGATWTVLDNSWSGSSGGWVIQDYNILDFAGQTDCRIRFTFAGGMLAVEGMAVDNIYIDELPSDEVSPIALVSPSSSCGLGNSESVKVLVKNYGVADQTGFDVSYSVDNGASWETETFTDVIAYDEDIMFAFTTPVDMQNIDTYEVIVATGLATDENTANDTLEQTVVHSETITVFPYGESFESGNAGWVADGENSSMELGEPAGTLINTASDGNYAWVTNLDGPHNTSEVAYLISPCFDFSGMVNPVIHADIIYETQAMSAGFILEYSTDYGEIWDTIPAGGAAENWYGGMFATTWNGSSSGWITVHNNMPVLAGEPTAMLRFAFDAGGFALNDYEGVGIDTISITDCDVLPVAEFEWEDIGGGTVQFTNLSENADSVEWNFGDNDIMPSTSNEENPSFTYATQGDYIVTLTVFNECGSDQVTNTVEVIITDINVQKQGVSIYPNPAGESLFVEAEGLKYIKLYSLDGVCLLHKNCSNDLIKVNTEKYAAGMYFIKITSSTGTVNQQVIIK